jgi:hypothetical protein
MILKFQNGDALQFLRPTTILYVQVTPFKKTEIYINTQCCLWTVWKLKELLLLLNSNHNDQ